jgi:hypothetical protein
MIAVKLPDGRVIQTNAKNPADAMAGARRFLAYEDVANRQSGDAAYQAGQDNPNVPAWMKVLGKFTHDVLQPTIGAPLQGVSNAAANGATLGLDDAAMGGVNAAITGVRNLINQARGKTPAYSAGDAYAAQRAYDKQQAGIFARNHPIAATATSLAGGFAMPGAAQLGELTAGKGLPGVLGAKGLLPTVARSGAIGAGVGTINGAANAKPGQELAGASNGAIMGGLTGAAIPALAGAAGAAVNRVAKPVATAGVRLANKAFGGTLLDHNQVAAQHLASALKADGADPATIGDAVHAWLMDGVTPSLMDAASSLPSGGRHTIGLLRGVTLKAGPAQGVATNYADQIAADLQDSAISKARALTPDKRPAQTVLGALQQSRDDMAQQLYREPSATPVESAPVVDAVSGQTGRDALRMATKLADANRASEELAQLQAIRSAANPPPAPPLPAGAENLGPAAQAQVRQQLGLDDGPALPPMVRLGTLDHLKQGLNQMGQDAVARGNNRLAAGLFQRAKDIDDYLADQSQPYQMARDNFHQGSNRMEGVRLGLSGLTASPEDLAASIQDLQSRVQGQGPSPAQLDAGVGYRQAITDAIGRPTEGATGVLNRLSTATNQSRNLATVFGQGAADRFQAGIGRLVDQVNNARAINPGTNSQTAGRLADAALVDLPSIPLTRAGIVSGLINKVRSGLTLTDPERTALLDMGTARGGTLPPDVMSLLAPKAAPTYALSGALSVPLAVAASR